MGDPQSLVTASAALSAFRVPVVSVSPSFYSDIGECQDYSVIKIVNVYIIRRPPHPP